MAVSLGFGVLFATAITLYLIPCSLLLADDLKKFFLALLTNFIGKNQSRSI